MAVLCRWQHCNSVSSGLAVATAGLSNFVCGVSDVFVPHRWNALAVLFMCEGRIGLCCIFVVHTP